MKLMKGFISRYGIRILAAAVISVAIIIAYACPYAYRRIAESWNGVTSVPVLVTAAVLASASLYIIWNYKGYQAIVRELVFARREDFN